jgi:hypothetical protein
MKKINLLALIILNYLVVSFIVAEMDTVKWGLIPRIAFLIVIVIYGDFSFISRIKNYLENRGRE